MSVELRKRIMAVCMTMCMVCMSMLSGITTVNAETIYVDRKADVVFVIDGTGSMQPYITSVKTNLTEFINQIGGEDIDVRVKFVVYRDITCSETAVCSNWYSEPEDAISYLDSVYASGGGDYEETMLDGMGQLFTSGFGFRTEAIKFCITLTDATTKIDNTHGYTCSEEVI